VPRSTIYLPLAVLTAFLPGLYGLRHWDLNPPGPWWGIRGLEVLSGRLWDQVGAIDIGSAAEVQAYRAVALQPPLFAWLEAICLAASPGRAPIATVIPSYLAGAFVVLLVYGLGKRWAGQGVGVVAAVLTGFNRHLLMQMQQATPTTLGLLGAVGAVACYARQLERPEQFRWKWAILGGLSLAASLLAVGAFGLLVLPVFALHAASCSVASRAWHRPVHRQSRARRHIPPCTIWLAVVTIVALAVAGPWYVSMFNRYGEELIARILAAPQNVVPLGRQLVARLLELAPALVPLAGFGVVKIARAYATTDADDRITTGGMLALAWLVVGAIAPVGMASGPRPAMALFLVAPLSLLASWVIVELALRRIGFRWIFALAPATGLSVAWWSSSQLRQAISDLVHGRGLQAATAFGLQLGIGLILAFALAAALLERFTQGRDNRRRAVLGLYLAIVLGFTLAIGLREVEFRHRETKEFLALRNAVVRRHQNLPITVIAVVGSEAKLPTTSGFMPGGRIRFMLRSALPHLSQIDVRSVKDLRDLPGGQRLVLVIGGGQQLSHAEQSRLNLEVIHNGRMGVEGAFATVLEPTRPRKMIASEVHGEWIY
jgi:4-amino-4-deoxy-L-arabinose transferase-like glycosyltransferase